MNIHVCKYARDISNMGMRFEPPKITKENVLENYLVLWHHSDMPTWLLREVLDKTKHEKKHGAEHGEARKFPGTRKMWQTVFSECFLTKRKTEDMCYRKDALLPFEQIIQDDQKIILVENISYIVQVYGFLSHVLAHFGICSQRFYSNDHVMRLTKDVLNVAHDVQVSLEQYQKALTETGEVECAILGDKIDMFLSKLAFISGKDMSRSHMDIAKMLIA